MGLSIANVLDPLTNTQMSPIAQLNKQIAMFAFLAMDAHHWFLRALIESFHLVPLFDFQFNSPLMEHLIRLTSNMFLIAIKVGAPVMAVLFISTVVFGLVARTVPQMNVFIVAMPLKIGVGLLFLGFSLPYFAAFLKKIFHGLGLHIAMMLNSMSSFQ